MILKCAIVIFLGNAIITQAQNNSSDLDVLNSVFFQKFFKEFHKQYEELQKSKKVTTLPHVTTPSTIHTNISSVRQNTEIANIGIRKTNNRPLLNPLNPYFTISPDLIRPTRRPHTNPFFKRRPIIQATTVRHSTVFDVSTGENKHNFSENVQTFKARSEEISSAKVDTKPNFPFHSQNVTTLPPEPTSYESTTIHINISSVPQNTQITNISIRKTSNRPLLNTLNPYFTISPDSIRPSRKPHANPFFKIITTTQATTVQHSTFASTEESKHNLSKNLQTLEARSEKLSNAKVDTETDFFFHIQNETTLPPEQASYESSTIDTNITSDPPNNEIVNISDKKTSKPPTLNPVNPYFTTSPNLIKATRRPHTHQLFKIRTTTEAIKIPQSPLVGVSTEENQLKVSNNGQSLIERFEQITGEKVDTNKDFLSFVQSALAATPKRRQEINQSNPTQSVPNLVRKLVKIVPKSKIEVQSEVEPEVKLRPRDDVFTKTSRTKNDYQKENSKVQNQNARYTFASDVQDSINGNVHQRHEQREGNKVTGMYTYEDGFFRRTVHYEADENGYRVVKEDVQAIGNGPLINPDGSAKVKAIVAGNVVDYQVTNEDIYRKKPVRYRTIQDPQYYYSQQ